MMCLPSDIWKSHPETDLEIAKTQMYVHMFTCKKEPWLARQSSAAVTNGTW